MKPFPFILVSALSLILSTGLVFADDGNQTTMVVETAQEEVHIVTDEPDELSDFEAEPESVSGESETFSDLPKTNRYHSSVMYLYDRGVVEGYTDGTFGLYNPVNRVEALKIIIENFGIEVEENANNQPLPFSDIDENAWYIPYIRSALENNIISSDTNGTFRPNDPVNLAEAVKMFIQAGGERYVMPSVDLNAKLAEDVFGTDWFARYVNFSLQEKAIYADAGGYIHPGNTMNRGQLSELIFRFMNPGVYSGEVEFGVATWYGSAVDGSGTASGETFDHTQFTAAHKSLPFGTWVRVTNLWNDKVVEVRITDRGPYGEGRVIDLTSGAFEVISPLGAGVLNVEVEVINK